MMWSQNAGGWGDREEQDVTAQRADKGARKTCKAYARKTVR